MAYGPGPTQFFNAQKVQDFLNFDNFGLNYAILQSEDHLENGSKTLLWSSANRLIGKIAQAYITGADPQLREAANTEILKWARTSIERQDWKPWERLLTAEELRIQYYKDVGKVFIYSMRERPEAWLEANFVLLDDAWFKTGTVDKTAVDRILSKPMHDVPMLQGIEEPRRLISFCAWDAVRELPFTLNPQGLKHKKDATLNIGILLADDPAQLHDRKSPARVRARSLMRRHMEEFADRHPRMALEWLRLTEWREGQSGLSPQEVMLRAYAYMPEVEPPANIAAQVAQLRKIPI
jgi:hypothetical protein